MICRVVREQLICAAPSIMLLNVLPIIRILGRKSTSKLVSVHFYSPTRNSSWCETKTLHRQRNSQLLQGVHCVQNGCLRRVSRRSCSGLMHNVRCTVLKWHPCGTEHRGGIVPAKWPFFCVEEVASWYICCMRSKYH